MSVEEMIKHTKAMGIKISVRDGNLVCKPARAVTPRVASGLRRNKSEIIKFITKSKKLEPVPYLDAQGRFCVRGGLLKKSTLDALLEVKATRTEVEKHIHPIGSPKQWQRWLQMNKRS